MAVLVLIELAGTMAQCAEVLVKMDLGGKTAPHGIFHVAAEDGKGGLFISEKTSSRVVRWSRRECGLPTSSFKRCTRWSYLPMNAEQPERDSARERLPRWQRSCIDD